MKRFLIAMVLTLIPVLSASAEQKWTTVKGRVVWPLDKNPRREVINRGGCWRPANKGPLLDSIWVIHPKNKGIRWVQVYVVLVDEKGKAQATTPVPIHPKLKKVKLPDVVLDIPCCEFDSPVVGLQVGQKLVIKNSSLNVHNVGGRILPGEQLVLPVPWRVDDQHFPVALGCNVHNWMRAFVRVFNHPYHTVTDENGNFELANVPMGDNVRLVFWHRTGWCVGDFRHGIKIPAPKNGVVDLGKVKILPPEE